jgi:hypothetical protein
MKLSARQRKFMTVCIEGACPWAMPVGGPMLRNHEIHPLISKNLIFFDKAEDCWRLTDAGRAELASGKTCGSPPKPGKADSNAAQRAIAPTVEQEALYRFDAENKVEPQRVIAERVAAIYGLGKTHPIVDDISHAIEDAREVFERRGRVASMVTSHHQAQGE